MPGAQNGCRPTLQPLTKPGGMNYRYNSGKAETTIKLKAKDKGIEAAMWCLLAAPLKGGGEREEGAIRW